MASINFWTKSTKQHFPFTYKAVFIVWTILVIVLLQIGWSWLCPKPLFGYDYTDTMGYNADRMNCPAKLFLAKTIDAHRAVEQISPYTNDRKWSSTTWNQTVLILTPVSNAKKYLSHYFKLLCSLNYPHHLISVGIGEDSSADGTYAYAQNLSHEIRPYFRNVSVLRFKDVSENIAHNKRHAKQLQLMRRSQLAKARNKLLQRALRNEEWVLWVDVDLDYYPPDIIQHLLSSQKPVVVPNCIRLHNTRLFYQNYDLNTFRETKESLALLKDKPEDFLMVSDSWTPRIYLRDIRKEGLVVPLDGVGGCLLLVESKYHRQGLLFPTKVFEHHIETEGLGKKAVRMGLNVSGLPFVNAIHRRDSFWE